jgi:glutamate--cysteine ligase
MAAIEKICPEAKNLLLIPEKHTRNPFYVTNLQRLLQVFHQAGLNVRLGSLDETIRKPTPLALPDGSELTVEPLVRTRGRLGLKGFDPCTILLNTDLSDGIPSALAGLHEQYVLPPLHAGWAVRRKSNHFQAYEEVAKKFAKLLGMDPWLINPMFARCGEVSFSEGGGIEGLANHADALLGKVRRKYKEYGIQERPFIVVKADAGTCGMGIVTLRDARELPGLTGKLRDRFGAKLEGQTPCQVMLQEGVPSYEHINDAVAEPVVYMIDRYVVGGFYRVHAEPGSDEDLSAPGASFVPLAFAEANQLPKPGVKPGASAPNRFYMYGVIARLAMVAASYELEATDPNAEEYA